MNKEKITALQQLLVQPKTIVIVPHKNPDGDAIGSCLALFHYLKQKHQCSLIAPNNYPDFLKWLPGQEHILFYEKEETLVQKKIDKADLIFTLDFNHLSRSGAMQTALEKATTDFVMIDHHQQPDTYAKYTFSDANQSSTCQLLYHLFEHLEVSNEITPEIATCLYTGIMTDTGSFRFPSTTGATHRVIANLIEKGANNAYIHQQVFDNNSYQRMKLLGLALNTMKVIPEMRTAYISLSQEDLDKHQFKKGDTEGFVNYGLALKGVIFAVIFIENKAENIIKISFRSKGSFDVNQFARNHFQGGGHINAAGGKSNKSLSETITVFEKILPEYTHKLNNL